MSQELLTDEEEGFGIQEKMSLFKLGFEDGDLDRLDENDVTFNRIKDTYMRILSLAEEEGGYGINDVTYEQLMSDDNNDNYLIPNHPDLRRRTVANETFRILTPSTGGRKIRRTNKRKTKRRTNKRRTNKKMTKRRMSKRNKK